MVDTAIIFSKFPAEVNEQTVENAVNCLSKVHQLLLSSSKSSDFDSKTVYSSLFMCPTIVSVSLSTLKSALEEGLPLTQWCPASSD